LKRSEDSAISFLMPARKEAGMSNTERNRLWQLSKEHSNMITALDNIGKKYAEWQNTLLDTDAVHDPLLLDSKRNPFKWSDEERHKREARVLKWKAQQENMQQVVRLLEETIEAVSVPEDAFDELGSDI
jgi:DNA-binding CsgD family transcriptional regulator